MELSVTEYAKRLGITRSAVLLQIKEKRLPKNVTVKKIGNTYLLNEIKKCHLIKVNNFSYK
jgi:predicted DNA-binding transcriptional regulator AlpA